MTATTCILKFLFREEWKVQSSAFSTTPVLSAEEFMTANDLVTYATTESSCLVLVAIKDKSDVLQLANFIKLSKTVAKDIQIKTLVVNFSGGHQFDPSITKLGVKEIIESHITAKALRFKIDLILKSMVMNSQKEIQNAIKKTEDKKGDVKKAPGSQIEWLPALDCENDIWLIKNETTDCKKILGRWMIRLVGPGPYAGQWTEVSNKNKTWSFDLRPENKDVFLPEEGSWYFSGDQKPDFVWKDNIWLIMGSDFDLYHLDKDQTKETRLELKNRVLSVTKNSPFALAKEEFITESFDKELVVKNENKEDVSETLENNNVIQTHLEGKTETEFLEQNNLSGKNKTLADSFEELRGKIQNREEDLLSDDLCLENQSEQNDDLSGQSETSRISTHTKNKKEKAEERADSEDLKGKNKKEDPIETYLSSERSLTKKQKEETEKVDYEGFLEKKNKDLQGKNETEKLSKYYGNESDNEEDSLKDHPLHGENETETIETYLTSKKALNKKDKKEGSENEKFLEENLRDLEEKSSTDKISKYYGDESGFEKKPLVEDLQGESATDSLSTYYNSSRSQNNNEESGMQNKEEVILSDDNKSLDDLWAELKKETLGEGTLKTLEERSQIDKKLSEYELEKQDTKKEKQIELDEPLMDVSEKKMATENDPYIDIENDKQRLIISEDQHKDKEIGERATKDIGDQSVEPTDDPMSETLKELAALAKSVEEKHKSPQIEGESYSEVLKKKMAPAKKTSVDEDIIKFEDFSVSASENETSESKNISLNNGDHQDTKVQEDDDYHLLERACRDGSFLATLTQNDLVFDCLFDDCFDDVMILYNDHIKVSLNEKIQVELTSSYLHVNESMRAEGVVSRIDDGFISIQVDETKQNTLMAFMKVFELRQQNINLFMKYAKG